MSRHQIDVATPLSPLQVATSEMGSRHQTNTIQPEPCRDIKSVSRHHPGISRSRHQNQVATLLEATLCRDIKFMSRHCFCPQWAFQVATPKSMSRPPILPPMSRHQIHVATPFPPNQSRPGRDTTSWSRPHA